MTDFDRENPHVPGGAGSCRRAEAVPPGTPGRESGRHRRGGEPGRTRFEAAAEPSPAPYRAASPPLGPRPAASDPVSSLSAAPSEDRGADEPGAGRTAAWAPSAVEPDPLVDSDAVGLRKFDLGMVPASVTPPRSWRNAAWFTVTTSMTALAALLATTALFLGPDPHRRPPDSLPVFPSGTRLPAPQETTTTVPTIGAPHLLAARDSTTATAPAESGRDDSGASGGHGRLSDAASEQRTPDGATAGADATHPAGAASTTTVAPTTSVPFVTVGEGTPVVSATEIKDQTVAFFNAIGPDVDSAFKLVTGELAEAGLPVFAQLHDDVAMVELRHITVDPVKGITISTVVVTHDDGTQSTEYRELRFEPSAEPLITVDRVIPRSQW